ncbi:MAG TPA: DNA polymerase III subunit gamma/tau [Candidatus Limnocylindrales bacterium]|nr:DNA polymerase III subunit gamma/tau [Candidatus Limnocylindrales bacterium]
MSYLVLARKWRPQNFEDVAGQEPITRTLKNAIKANRIAHAYLFTGVRGVGKTTAARILAKALNCERGPTATPCNQCTHCQEITGGNSIDVLEIDGASNRGIDEIRQIIENVRYQPAKCRFKIYIIDEVHQVTKDAFNALLKTLEEPPPAVKFILATTEPQRLPETILSRCQRYDFRRISLREIVERLSAIGKSEGLNITDEALVLLGREADGSMRDAQSLLEQVLACAMPAAGENQQATVNAAMLQEILGLAERKCLYDLSQAVLDGDPRRCVELVAEVMNQGRDLSRLSRDLVEHFRNLLVARLSASRSSGNRGTDVSQLLDLPDQEIADLVRQTDKISAEALLDYLDFMAAGDEEVARSATPRFALEAVLIRLATLPQSLPVAEILTRLERLEGHSRSGNLRPAASTERSKTASIPASVMSTSVAPSPNDVVSSANDDTNKWHEFVAFVGKEKKFLASHLSATSAVSLPPAPLKVIVAERHHLGFLQDADNFLSLRTLAKQFFGQDVTIQFVASTGDSAPPITADASATGGAAGDRSEMVKEALRIFGGSVRSVRRET